MKTPKINPTKKTKTQDTSILIAELTAEIQRLKQDREDLISALDEACDTLHAANDIIEDGNIDIIDEEIINEERSRIERLEEVLNRMRG